MSLIFSQQPLAFAGEQKPEISTRQREIIRTVQSVDGYIDRKLHREFWDLMPDAFKRSPSGGQYLKQMLSEVSEERENFLTESWRSAQESLRAKRVVKTEGYLSAQSAALNASTNISYLTQIRQSIESAERMLAAAANGDPVETPGGKIYLTSDLIDRVLSGINASEFRLAKLIDRQWSEDRIEFHYPEASVSVLSTTPFVSERKLIKDVEGRSVDMVMLNQNLGKSTYQAIGFSTARSHFANPTKSVISIAKAGLSGAGATADTHVISSNWRGYTSATVVGTATTSEGPFFIAIRVAEIPELMGVIQFMVVSDLSAAEAINLREILEENTNVIAKDKSQPPK